MVLAGSLLGPTGPGPALARPLLPTAVAENVPIGSALQVAVAVEGAGQPGAQALLYEALPAPTTAADTLPPAPLRVPLPLSNQPPACAPRRGRAAPLGPRLTSRL